MASQPSTQSDSRYDGFKTATERHGEWSMRARLMLSGELRDAVGNLSRESGPQMSEATTRAIRLMSGVIAALEGDR